MSATEEETRKPSRWRRLGRGCWRCFRTGAVIAALTVAVLGLFLNKVGLPEFVKSRVIARARARGLEVQFSRLRLRWYRGIVADSLQIEGTNALVGPHLFVAEAECPLNPAALRNFRFRMNSLHLRGGRLIWPLLATNEPPRTLVLNDMNGDLRFLLDGHWEVSSVRATYRGVKVELNGTLTNPLALRDWQAPRQEQQPPTSTTTLLHRVESLVGQLRLTGEPEVRLKFSGDGKDLSTFTASIYCSFPELLFQSGAATNLVAFGQLLPPSGTNNTASIKLKASVGPVAAVHAQTQSGRLELEFASPFQGSNGFVRAFPAHPRLKIELLDLETRWGQAGRLSLTTISAASTNEAALATTTLTATGENVRTGWGTAEIAHLKAIGDHSWTNWAQMKLSSELHLEELQSQWGQAQTAQARAQIRIPDSGQVRLFETNLSWLDRLQSVLEAAAVAVTNLHSPRLDADGIALALESRGAQLRFASSGKLNDEKLQFDGTFTLGDRELLFTTESNVDPQRIASLLFTNTQNWLSNFTFQAPPRLAAAGRVLLPAWTNPPPEWPRQALTQLSLAGKIEAGPGSYRNVAFTSAQTPFTFTNLLGRLSGLTVQRPEGAIEGDCDSDAGSRDFHARLRSQIDPQILKPLFPPPDAQTAFDFFKLTNPPVVQAEIRGRWGEPDRLVASADVALTNLAFRGEPVKDIRTHLQYTDKVLTFIGSELRREDGETGAVQSITLDLDRQMLFFTNGTSTLNPYVVARAISKPAIGAIAPYQYDAPPLVLVNGAIDLKRKRYEEDIHFDISGNHFHWETFQLEHLMGRIDWVGQTLTLTNVAGSLKTGRLAGNARFDFAAPHDADFRFRVDFDKADLHEIATAFSPKTNKLEGLLTGTLDITQANTGNLKSWQGHGRLNLHDGLIWDIPTLGLFSPILNSFVPGMGNSRANEADATFVVTNGVFFTKDTEIHAPLMRMRFKGAVGLDQRIDARVEAELLRDVPAVGIVISKMFWPVTKLFEYKVTGNVIDPKAEPLYVVPRILLMPFHPFKTLKGLFVPEEPRQP